jgi:HK97 family phage major capsid protein
MSGFKMAVSGTGTGTFDGRIGGAPADAFLAAVRDTSVLMQLMSMGLRVVPPRTRVYVDSNGVVVGEVAEGLAAPVLRGSWADTVLSPRKWVGLLVVTEELFKSNEPTVLSTLTSDLAAAIGEGENKAALHPDETGSVTANALAIASAGDDVAGVDADLKGMLAQVPAAAKGSGAWAMPRSTCQHIALLRGSGGSPAFPGVTATGGTLVGLPIFLTEGLSDFSSPPTSVICLLAANQILYSLDQRVELDSSRNALIEMSDAPTGDARAGTAASVNQVSMFQTHAVCLRAGMMSSWHARSGAATYCRVGY